MLIKVSLNFNPEHPVDNKSPLCSGDGLAPNRRQAITWNSDDPVEWHIYASPGLNELIVTKCQHYNNMRFVLMDMNHWMNNAAILKARSSQLWHKSGIVWMVGHETLKYLDIIVLAQLSVQSSHYNTFQSNISHIKSDSNDHYQLPITMEVITVLILVQMICFAVQSYIVLNMLMLEQGGKYLTHDIFKYMLLNEKLCIMSHISPVPTGSIDNRSTLVHVMAWCYQETSLCNV